MAIETQAAGKTYEPTTYAVGREKIREYASAVGETNPLHFDVEAARAAGYQDVVAPPMFAVVYASRAVVPALFDPEVGMNFAMMVHGGQEFRWGPVVVAGDEITTTAKVKDISERGGMAFYVFESVSENQRGETVCTGVWTNIVRGAS
jgi:acyl dehydratase